MQGTKLSCITYEKLQVRGITIAITDYHGDRSPWQILLLTLNCRCESARISAPAILSLVWGLLRLLTYYVYSFSDMYTFSFSDLCTFSFNLPKYTHFCTTTGNLVRWSPNWRLDNRSRQQVKGVDLAYQLPAEPHQRRKREEFGRNSIIILLQILIKDRKIYVTLTCEPCVQHLSYITIQNLLFVSTSHSIMQWQTAGYIGSTTSELSLLTFFYTVDCLHGYKN